MNINTSGVCVFGSHRSQINCCQYDILFLLNVNTHNLAHMLKLIQDFDNVGWVLSSFPQSLPTVFQKGLMLRILH